MLIRGLARALARGADDTVDTQNFIGGGLWSSPSITGIAVNQQTALQATACLACISILAEDVSKMTPQIFRRKDVANHPDGGREVAKSHELYDLLWRPNDWMTWPEFCRYMMVAYLLRGNAYAVMLHNNAGEVTSLVPVNPDRVALWESPNGMLFCKVTRAGLHERAVLSSLPLLIPYENVFHLRDLSANGLVGMSRIAINREAIGLSIAQEQQYARLMGNGARPSGILTTENKLTGDTAKRIADDWNKTQGGLTNTGRTVILEQGLKWQALTLTSADLQFLQMRQFQMQEICRIWRVPPHMVGDLSKGTFSNIVQQSQEYRNNTLTSHTDMWEKRFDFYWELRKKGMFVDCDESKLLKADITARYNVHRIAKLSGIKSTNEIRMDEGLDPVVDGDEIMQPVNMAELGSDMSGNAADNAGRPEEGQGGEGGDGGGVPGDEPKDTSPQNGFKPKVVRLARFLINRGSAAAQQVEQVEQPEPEGPSYAEQVLAKALAAITEREQQPVNVTVNMPANTGVRRTKVTRRDGRGRIAETESEQE